jgi:hypothetical protein
MNISILNEHDYDSFAVKDIEGLLNKIKGDKNVAPMYKSMNAESFKNWVEMGITRKQFEKLRMLNDSIMYN